MYYAHSSALRSDKKYYPEVFHTVIMIFMKCARIQSKEDPSVVVL